MSRLVVLCLAMLAAVALAAKPQFPTDYTTHEVDQILQFQGDFVTQGGYICCSLDSPACQAQVQEQTGRTSFDYSHNRTRFDDDGGQIIVTLFDKQKECLVVEKDGVYTCQEYCPLQGDVLTPFGIGDNATYIGQTVIGGVTADDYQWKETIFGILTMEVSDMYIDSSTNPPTPLLEIDQLTPFGQHIGNFTTTWKNFQGGTPDPKLLTCRGSTPAPCLPTATAASSSCAACATSSSTPGPSTSRTSNRSRSPAGPIVTSLARVL